MRQYFYKSGFLLLIFTAVAVLFSLCGIAIMNQKQSEKILPFLSENYLVVYDTGHKYTQISDYADLMKKLDTDYTAGILLENRYGCALYSVKQSPEHLKITEGRYFTQKDYKQHSDVVMLREDMETLCEKRNGNYYYSYLGTEYEVIGWFQDIKRSSVSSIQCIFNIYSESLSKTESWEIAFLDMGESGMDAVSHCEEVANSGLEFYPMDSDKGNVNSDIVSNVNMMIGLYLLVAIMVFLNVFMATKNWLRGKRKEIAVRKMAGATAFSIYHWLLFSFLGLVTIAFAIGVLFVKLVLFLINSYPLSSSMALMFGDRMRLMGLLVAFLVIQFIGFLVITIGLHIYTKKEIIEVIRSE